MDDERTKNAKGERPGDSTPDGPAGTKLPATPAGRGMVPVWPHLLFRELLALIACFVVLGLVSIWFNAPLEGPADPSTTPNPAKAPWYFVGLQELLVYFDPWIAGVMIPVVIIFGLSAIPYLDPSRKGAGVYSFRDRPVASGIFTVGLISWFVLIAVGLWFRGPGWSWIWPGSDGGSVPITESSRSLPNLVGVPLLALYFGGGGYAVLRWTRNWEGMSAFRRVVFAGLLLCMAGVAVKIVANLVFGLRYIVSFPGVGFNI